MCVWKIWKRNSPCQILSLKKTKTNLQTGEVGKRGGILYQSLFLILSSEARWIPSSSVSLFFQILYLVHIYMICICHRWEIGHPSHRALLKTFTLVPTQKPFSLLFLLVRYFFLVDSPICWTTSVSPFFTSISHEDDADNTNLNQFCFFFHLFLYSFFIGILYLVSTIYLYTLCVCTFLCVLSLFLSSVSMFQCLDTVWSKNWKRKPTKQKRKTHKKKQTFIRERNTNMVSSSGFLFYFVSILPRVWSLVTSPSLSLSSFWWYDFYCWFCTIFQMFFPSHSPT